MTRNNIIRFVNIIYIHKTKSPVVIHLVLKTRVNKQTKPSFSLKILKVKTLCQDSQASATNRVPKCDIIKNEICEIMGFVKLF